MVTTGDVIMKLIINKLLLLEVEVVVKRRTTHDVVQKSVYVICMLGSGEQADASTLPQVIRSTFACTPVDHF